MSPCGPNVTVFVWSQLRFDPAAALKMLVVGHGVGVLRWFSPGGRGTEIPG